MTDKLTAKFDGTAIIAGVVSLLVGMVTSATVYYISTNDTAIAKHDSAIIVLKEDVAVVKVIVTRIEKDIHDIKTALSSPVRR